MRTPKWRELHPARFRLVLSAEFAVAFGIILSSLGIYILWTGTNQWAAILTLATLAIYLLLYTPMKKRSPYATEVGAVSGALPPLIGWVAAEGAPTTYGWILFGILFAWQLPHFMAIAWNFREDYSKGGFKLHQLGDPEGRSLARKSLIYSFLLTLFVFCPTFCPSSNHGLVYFIFCIVGGPVSLLTYSCGSFSYLARS